MMVAAVAAGAAAADGEWLALLRLYRTHVLIFFFLIFISYIPHALSLPCQRPAGILDRIKHDANGTQTHLLSYKNMCRWWMK